ncbi:hypothetical protein A2U01_0015735, partial [Trifolium medium]|nr:hypothetical protein [Trifolium medium]
VYGAENENILANEESSGRESGSIEPLRKSGQIPTRWSRSEKEIVRSKGQ